MTLDPCDPCSCIPGYIGENEFFQKALEAQCQILSLIGGGGEFVPPTDCTISLGTALKRFKDIYLCGDVHLSAASAKIIPGATSLLFQNNADTFNNLTITDAGLVTIARSDLVMTTGALIMASAQTANKGILTGLATQPADIGATNIYAFGATTVPGLTLAQGSADTAGQIFNIVKSRAVDGSADTIVVNGDTIGTINFKGANGTTFDTAAKIVVTVDGTPGASADMPGAIDFQVSPNGTATPVSVLKFTNDQNITYGSTTGLNISAATADAADSSSIILNGGGANGSSRGGSLEIYGNENGSTGKAILRAGNVTGGTVVLATGGADRVTVNKLGDLLISTINQGLLIGDSTVPASIGGSPAIFIAKTAGVDTVDLEQYGNDANSTTIRFHKTRSATTTVGTIVQSGDEIARINFKGDDGTAFRSAATILVTVDGTPGASDMPGAIDFQVSPDGSATPASALKISNTKQSTFAGRIVLPGTGGAVTSIINGTAALDTDLTNVVSTHCPAILIQDASAVGDHFASVEYGANAIGVQWKAFKTRETTAGSTSANTIVQSGDSLLDIGAYGANGSDYSISSRIRFTVDGTPGAGSDMPGAIDFQVSPDGAANPASALKLTNDKIAHFAGVIQTAAAQESTGAGTALLSTNCPASTVSAPYTWLKFKTSDNSTVYIPCWK